MEIFGNTGGKKSRTANKVELSDFDWDDVPVDGGKKKKAASKTEVEDFNWDNIPVESED